MFNALHKMLRHMWEITATTGRRIGEVLQIRWDCLGRDGSFDDDAWASARGRFAAHVVED